MKKRDRLFAYGISRLIKLLLLSCLLIAQSGYAQDTVSLKTVEIRTNKEELGQIGKKIEPIDSLAKDQNRLNSIGDLLTMNSGIFIKNYGPGAIATTAFRGGNASQTAVLWNGFNIQNAMLGQSDLALMPSILFETIDVEYGGSSSLWGSGAVAGSIHLGNKHLFKQGIKTSTHLNRGSFGQMGAATSFLISKERFISSTKLYLNNSVNNFTYRDTSDKEKPFKQQKSGEYSFIGFMQELKFLIKTTQILTVNAWLNSNKRHLPGYNLQEQTKTYQKDDAIRLTGNWIYTKTKFKSALKAGFFKDAIYYDDSLTSVSSKSKSNVIIAENENYWEWNKNNQLNFGVNYTSSKANSNNYINEKTISKTSVLVGNKFSLIKNKLIAYTAARIEFLSVGALPLTGNASINYKPIEEIALMFSAAKVYRQPTLNELYWLPGGNVRLKPEQGYTLEGSVNCRKQIKKMTYFMSASIYSREINDWILWISGSGSNPSPINLQKVWSRGTETTWKINYNEKKWKAASGIITTYVLSTVKGTDRDNDNTLGRQLIYTPRYQVNANFSLTFQKINLTYYYQYVGYRYTNSDNSEWINPYHISSLRFNNSFTSGNTKVVLFVSCNNLLNANYSSIAGRPMPLRNFELGINLQTGNEIKH